MICETCQGMGMTDVAQTVVAHSRRQGIGYLCQEDGPIPRALIEPCEDCGGTGVSSCCEGQCPTKEDLMAGW